MTPRIAHKVELKAICDAMTSHYGVRFYDTMAAWMDAKNTEYLITCEDIIIRDRFVGNKQKFSGSVAWVQFGGGPEFCCILSRQDPPNTGHPWTWSIVDLDVS